MARKVIFALAGVTAIGVFAIQFAGETPDLATSTHAKASEPPAHAIEAAKNAIREEPKVKDFSYQPGQVVEWHVGVLDDGTPRYGYAGYICQVLDEHGALTARTHVRVVDIVKVSQGENFRSTSLGHVACSDFRVIVP